MTGKFRHHARVLATGSALGMLAFLAVGSAAVAQEAGASHVFSIPAQSVATALVRYGAVTGMNIVYDGALPQDAHSHAIQGRMQDRQALQDLLAGTGLQFSFGSNDTITIVSPDAAANAADGATPLQVITISGSSEQLAANYAAADTSLATKTDTPLREVPQSIQVVKRSVLEDQQTRSVTQALENVSNVQESSTSANRASSYMMRGFTTNSYAVNGIMLDGGALDPEVSTEPDMAAIERVEVLKGPASVLYGRGGPGGLVNIVTRQPTEDFTAEAKTEIGSYGFQRAEATTSGALNKDGTLTARLTASAQHDEGFEKYRSASERQYVGTDLQWKPDEDTKVNLSASYTHQTQPYDRGLVVGADGTIDIPYDRFLGEDWSTITSKKTQVSLTGEHRVNDWLKFRGGVHYTRALSHDYGIDFRGLEDDGRTLKRRYNNRKQDLNNLDFQLESVMDFETGNISHKVLAGVEEVRSSLNFARARGNIASIDIYDPVYGAPMTVADSSKLAYNQTILTSSAYLQDQIDLTDKWKLLGGLRYDYFDEDMDVRIGDDKPSMNDGALTGRAGIVYQPIEPISLYASYATSFMPQSGVGANNSALAPEKGWQVEAGVKADLIPDRLSTTFSVFQITKNNVAVDVPNEDYSRLSGQQRSRGVEMDMSGTILPGWKVIGSLGYLDAVVTKDTDADTVGNRLTGTPHWSGSLWTTYEFQSGAFEGVTLGTGITAVGKRYGDLDNSFSVAGYYRLDASFSYQINKHLEFSLMGRNLTDQHYIETTVSDTENHAGAPINVMASLKATF